MSNCPVCDLAGGFHDDKVHANKRVIPEALQKTKGWHEQTDQLCFPEQEDA